MTCIIYGASDDLVEIEGEHLREEIDCYDEAVTLTFDTGHVVRMSYGNGGVWSAEILAGGGEIDRAVGPDAGDREDGSPGYSDRVTLRCEPKRVKVRKGPAPEAAASEETQ